METLANRADAHPMFAGWNSRALSLLAILVAVLSVVLRIVDGNPSPQPVERPVLVVEANTCPAAVFEALPRLGAVLADRIVVERESMPFRSIEEIDSRVQGIGPVTLNAIRPFLRIRPRGRETSVHHENPTLSSRRNSNP